MSGIVGADKVMIQRRENVVESRFERFKGLALS
jgi:hypothetical protein